MSDDKKPSMTFELSLSTKAGRVMQEAFYASVGHPRPWAGMSHWSRHAWIAAAYAAQRYPSSEWSYKIFREFTMNAPGDEAVERWDYCAEEFKLAWGVAVDATGMESKADSESSPYMSGGAIEFDESKLSFRARMYIAEWSKRQGIVSRIPLGPPGERFIAWTDLTVLEVYDWRVFHKVAGYRTYNVPLVAICMPLDIEVIAEMHEKLQYGDVEMLAKFNAAVDHGTGVHPSVADGVLGWKR